MQAGLGENDSFHNGSYWELGYYPEEMDMSYWIKAVTLMKFVCVPLIASIGLFGNTLSLIVFSARSMKRSSCSVFLAALAAVDNTFLVALIASWLDSEIYPVLTSGFACQIIIYMTYVTSFLSSWFIVGFTCERFIAICFPLHSNYLCSVFREKVTVFTLTFAALGLYSFSIWTTEYHDEGPQHGCLHNTGYLELLQVAIWVDAFLTMVIPFCIIVVVNSCVLRAVAQSPLKTATFKTCIALRRSKAKMHTIKRKYSSQTFVGRTKTISTTFRRLGAKRSNPQVRVTRTLLLVSSTFLCLNLPAHAIRLYILISHATAGAISVSPQFHFIQEVANVLYYMTFSCNFVLYTLFGRNFKRSLFLILQCKKTTPSNRSKMLQRISSSRASIKCTGTTSL